MDPVIVAAIIGGPVAVAVGYIISIMIGIPSRIRLKIISPEGFRVQGILGRKYKNSYSELQKWLDKPNGPGENPDTFEYPIEGEIKPQKPEMSVGIKIATDLNTKTATPWSKQGTFEVRDGTFKGLIFLYKKENQFPPDSIFRFDVFEGDKIKRTIDVKVLAKVGKRAWKKFFAVSVIINIIFVILLAALFMNYPFGNSQTLTAKITYPSNGDVVNSAVVALGTSQNIPKGNLWIIVFDKANHVDLYYPMKNPANITANGNWNCNLTLGGSSDNGWKFYIIAVVANQTGQDKLKQYINDVQNGLPEGLETLPVGLFICDTVVVTHGSG